MNNNLYIKTPYEKSMETKIENLVPVDKGYKFNLENNIIYHGLDNNVPEDTFTFKDFKILDYGIEDNRYFYVTDNKPDDYIKVEIDWQKRLRIMQHNLGHIILDIVFDSLLGYKTLDYSISEVESHLIVSGKDLSFNNLKKVENLANYLLRSNLKVSVLNDQPVNNNYVIKIGEFSERNFSGPHILRTGELSVIKIISINKIDENQIKVNFKTGQSAYEDYFNKFDILNNLKIILKTNKDDEVIKLVKDLKLEIEKKESEIRGLKSDLGLKYVDEYVKSASDIDGIYYIHKVIKNVSFKELKYTSTKIMDKNNFIQIYGIPNGNISQVLICRSKNLNIDLKSIFDNMVDKFKLDGVGNMYSVQANCPTYQLSNVMDTFLIKIKDYLNKDSVN